MHRKITLGGVTHVADFGLLESARVTVKDGTVAVSPDMTARTEGADFEAIFIGTQSIEVLAGPTKALEDGSMAPDYEIGPLLDDRTPLERAKAAKLAELAATRYAAEIAGIVVNGMKVRTDRESQAMITGAALAAVQDANYTCKWKTESGFVTLTAAQIIAVATAVRSHVQAQFDREATLAAQVEAASTAKTIRMISWEWIP